MISLSINGKAVKVDARPDTPLLWVLRDSLQLTWKVDRTEEDTTIFDTDVRIPQPVKSEEFLRAGAPRMAATKPLHAWMLPSSVMVVERSGS